MVRPHEFVIVQTIASEEVRVDPETNEEYTEQIIIAKDKKLKTLIDLQDIINVEESINESGSIYAKRCNIITSTGLQAVVLSPYKEVSELVKNTQKDIGFGSGDKQKEKKSS